MSLKILCRSESSPRKPAFRASLRRRARASFGLLPRRLDCVAALAPGILIYEDEAEGEVYVAVDDGVLVKTGLDVPRLRAQRNCGRTSANCVRRWSGSF